MSTARAQQLDELGTSADGLPEGWARATLPECAAITMGQSPPGSTYNEHGVGLPFFQGKTEFGPRYPTVRVWCSAPHKIARAGDILLSVRAPVGPTNVANQTCAIGRGLAAIRPLGGIATEYLLFALREQEPQLSLEGTGSTFTAINRRHLDELELNTAPLKEQRRIVAKIEDLFTHVNASREHLAKVPKILKSFRQSVLAAACSGRLTEDWRKAHPDSEPAQTLLNDTVAKRITCQKGKSPLVPDLSYLDDVPENWAVASIDQLTCLVTSGSRGWAKYYSASGPLFVRAENINSDKLVLDDIAHVQPPKNTEGRRTRVEFGDLLVTITGANVTKSALVDTQLNEAYVSQHVALIRPIQLETRRYLYFWIVSPAHGRAKLLADAYGAGKPGLNLTNIRDMPVALPPLEEQHEIVRRVEALFKLADAIERRVAASTKRAEKLTQAILGKAFRGELVPTEAELARREGRDYEPASALLDRIKRERETQSEAKKPRRLATRRPRGRRKSEAR